MTETQEKRKGLGGFDKVLIGCGLGCAGLIVGAVLLGAFGTMWLFKPGEQTATDAIADDQSLGVIRLHEVADDPGTQELFTNVIRGIEEVQRQQAREDMPESMRWLQDLQGSQESNPAGLNMLIPRQMTVAFEANEDDTGLDYVVAFNPRAMVRMFKMMFGFIARNEESEMYFDYRGHDAYQMDDEGFVAFVGSTVLFGNTRRALERAVDRIEDVGAASSGEFSRSSFYTAGSIPDGDWDVEGALSNEAGLVDLLLEDVALDDAALPRIQDSYDTDLDDSLDSCGQFGFGIDILSADEIIGHAVLDCGDAERAKRWLPIIEQRFAAMIAKAEEEGHQLDIEAREDGQRIFAELKVEGVEALIVNAFARVSELEEADAE